mmetsp:Transcript_44448/g.105326  ORF Transcript_44448/g.105326 Transcript_44448/m.105326 type:complete len:200 (-) Transcript_44448:92-691(-)
MGIVSQHQRWNVVDAIRVARHCHCQYSLCWHIHMASGCAAGFPFCHHSDVQEVHLLHWAPNFVRWILHWRLPRHQCDEFHWQRCVARESRHEGHLAADKGRELCERLWRVGLARGATLPGSDTHGSDLRGWHPSRTWEVEDISHTHSVQVYPADGQRSHLENVHQWHEPRGIHPQTHGWREPSERLHHGQPATRGDKSR